MVFFLLQIYGGSLGLGVHDVVVEAPLPGSVHYWGLIVASVLRRSGVGRVRSCFAWCLEEQAHSIVTQECIGEVNRRVQGGVVVVCRSCLFGCGACKSELGGCGVSSMAPTKSEFLCFLFVFLRSRHQSFSSRFRFFAKLLLRVFGACNQVGVFRLSA